MQYQDVESQEQYFDMQGSQGKGSFAQLNPRLGFVRKVYSILSAQLCFTALLCFFATNNPEYKHFVLTQGQPLLIFCAIMTLVIMIILMCYKSVARSVPINYILLGAFTICESIIVSFSCALSDPELVLMAAVMTAGAVIALTVYAMTTDTDITMYGGVLFLCSMGLLLFSLFAMFTNNDLVHIIICSFSIILFGFYLIYDTQLIIGGKHAELTVDDYIVGALIIYIDIIALFIKILKLLNQLKKK